RPLARTMNIDDGRAISAGHVGPHFDLDPGAQGKGGHGDGRSGGPVPGEGVGIDLVHDRKIAHVEKEHRGLGHIAQRGSAVAQDGDDVGQRLARLGGHAAVDQAAGARIDPLLAERAEAEAQLRAAEATLGIPPPAVAGDDRRATSEEPGPASPNSDDVDSDGVADRLDVAELRRAAARARAADDVLARAASEAAERPLPDGAQLGTAESAFARALEVREDLPAAWRRLVGALISSTGMAIVIGALGWNVYWLLVPIALIAIMTVDLRVAGQAAREASVQAGRELASVGVAGADGLDRVRLERARIEEAESR